MDSLVWTPARRFRQFGSVHENTHAQFWPQRADSSLSRKKREKKIKTKSWSKGGDKEKRSHQNKSVGRRFSAAAGPECTRRLRTALPRRSWVGENVVLLITNSTKTITGLSHPLVRCKQEWIRQKRHAKWEAVGTHRKWEARAHARCHRREGCCSRRLGAQCVSRRRGVSVWPTVPSSGLHSLLLLRCVSSWLTRTGCGETLDSLPPLNDQFCSYTYIFFNSPFCSSLHSGSSALREDFVIY